MIEKALDEIAERILALDEASLTALWEKHKHRMEAFEPSRAWEKSVIIFFLINAVRVKNHIFNDRVLKKTKADGKKKEETPAGDATREIPPYLRRIK